MININVHFKKLFWIGASLALLTLSSCSTIEHTVVTERSKELILKKNHVKALPEKALSKYRKINRARVLVFNDLIITANSENGLSAFTSSDKRIVWQFYVPHGVEKEPVIFKENLYFGGNDGNFYSLNVKTGVENWKFVVKSEIVTTPAFDAKEGRVYFLTSANSIFALEAENGKQVWTYTRQDPSNYSIRGGTAPVIDGNIVYVGFSEGSFVAFNKSNGTINWEILLNKNRRFKDIDATSVIYEDKIYVSGYDDKLYCLSASHGDILWRFDAGGYVSVSISEGQLFYPTSQGKVVSLDKNTGRKYWEFELGEHGIATEIIFWKHFIIFGESQGSLVFLDKKSGKLISSYEPGRGIMTTPTIDNKTSQVYFISGESNLYSIEAIWKSKNLFSFLD